MGEIIRHFKIWLMLVRINFMSQMEYRVNFVTGILMEAGYLLAKTMYVIVAYAAGRKIAGFGPNEILVFVGSYVALTGFYAGALAMNLFGLSTIVRDGSFDMILAKPVNSQFYATFRRSDMGPFLFDTIAGIVMVIVGLVRAGFGFNPLGVLGWSFFAASGAAVGYALWVIPMTFVFRIVRADAIAALADSFWDFNNVPMVVYGRVGRAIGTFAIPIFVITNFPALFALGKLSPPLIAWGFAAPFVFGFIAARLWKSGLRHYASGGN
ncbi:MAG TPA: ABC-2 family transporter protein [Treponemataceae bacterium]|nr:ABC-2 family transporter protein [Treponemataceae bacterium]